MSHKVPKLVLRRILPRMQFFPCVFFFDDAFSLPSLYQRFPFSFISVHNVSCELSFDPKPVNLTFVNPLSNTMCLFLRSHGVSESSLKVLIQNISSLGNSVQEHVHCHEAQGFTVHLESVGSDSTEVECLGHPL